MEVHPPAEVQGMKPSLNTHRASSERPDIPAGEDREERKGRKRKETKKKERKKQLWEAISHLPIWIRALVENA